MKTDIATTNYMALPGLKPGAIIFGCRRTAADIITCVEDEFGILYDKMKSIHRYRRIVEARHVAMYLIRKHTNISLFEIGKMFGGRDHTTAIHSIQHTQDLIDTEPDFKQRLLTIENRL